MSMVIRQYKAAAAGDPGLFDFVGKAVRGVAGAVTGAAKGFLSGGVSGALGGAIGGGLRGIGVRPGVGGAGRPVLRAGASPQQLAAPVLGSRFAPIGPSGGFMPGTGIQFNTPLGGGAVGTFGPMQGTYATGGGAGPVAAPKGGHWNRSGYWTKDGYVPPGTKVVANRRMNPLNPRALNRSMRRIVSAKKAASFLNKIHFGNKPSGRRSCGGGCAKRKR